MSEIEALISNLRGARAANTAAIHAIDAALSILSDEKTVNTSAPVQTVDSSEDTIIPCKHEKAAVEEVGAGQYLICPCGHQEQLSA